MAIPSPNCIVLNENTGTTHYSTCDHEGKIIKEYTFCGKPIHDKYQVMTKHLLNMRVSCKVCNTKVMGSAIGYYDYSRTEW